MQGPTRPQIYSGFLEFIRKDMQHERSTGNRRMFSVLFWCFLLPIAFAVVCMVLMRTGILPRVTKKYLDTIVLIFPVAYSLYYLGAEVIKEVPALFKKGGFSALLKKSASEGEWRERVCSSLKKTLDVEEGDWRWLAANFEMDLDAMQHRSRYLTVLAGAVFFLIMNGFDLLDPQGAEFVRLDTVVLTSFFHYLLSQFSQMVILLLVLVLFYFSNNQTHHSLERYLNCLKLMSLGSKDKD